MSAIPPKLRSLVRERDNDTCVRCGFHVDMNGGGSIHHRKRRKDGGHTPDNMITLCGSGTTGCHGWVHANPKVATLEGFIVPTWGDPETMRIKYHGKWMLLDSLGGVNELSDM